MDCDLGIANAAKGRSRLYWARPARPSRSRGCEKAALVRLRDLAAYRDHAVGLRRGAFRGGDREPRLRPTGSESRSGAVGRVVAVHEDAWSCRDAVVPAGQRAESMGWAVGGVQSPGGSPAA